MGIKGQLRDKPFRDAIRMEAELAANGEETPALKGSLRWIARQMLNRAGDETAAAKEIADRLDGRVPQALVGDSDEDPINVLQKIERVVVDPSDRDRKDIQEAAGPGKV